MRFLENNRELLETAELGLFAVVPPDPELPVSQPGILFCLRQRDNKRPTEVNPLAPYYLVYVLDDGNVRLTFMQPMTRKEIMGVIGLRDEKHFREHYQQTSLAAGLLEMTIPEKPNSRLQKYRLTEKGRRMIYEG